MKQKSRRIGIFVVPALAAFGLLIGLGQPAGAATPDGKEQRVTATAAQTSPEVSPFEADCPRGPDSYDIGPGATGTAVKEVQCLLNWALSASAYPYIQVDGRYGPITTEGVKVFQRCANNLGAGLQVDGRVGPKTLPHLRWWGQQGYENGYRIC